MSPDARTLELALQSAIEKGVASLERAGLAPDSVVEVLLGLAAATIIENGLDADAAVRRLSSGLASMRTHFGPSGEA